MANKALTVKRKAVLQLRFLNWTYSKGVQSTLIPQLEIFRDLYLALKTPPSLDRSSVIGLGPRRGGDPRVWLPLFRAPH